MSLCKYVRQDFNCRLVFLFILSVGTSFAVTVLPRAYIDSGSIQSLNFSFQYFILLSFVSFKPFPFRCFSHFSNRFALFLLMNLALQRSLRRSKGLLHVWESQHISWQTWSIINIPNFWKGHEVSVTALCSLRQQCRWDSSSPYRLREEPCIPELRMM